MKRILLAALLLFPASALAQVMPANEIWRPSTPSYVQTLSPSALATTAPGFTSRLVRVVCSISCWMTLRASGNTIPATVATGVMVPALIPQIWSTQPGATISFISAAGTFGTVWVTELTR